MKALCVCSTQIAGVEKKIGKNDTTKKMQLICKIEREFVLGSFYSLVTVNAMTTLTVWPEAT